jgi:hypothetical protein
LVKPDSIVIAEEVISYKNLIFSSRIKRLAEERDDLKDQVRRLKLDLEEEKSRSQKLESSTPEESDWETKRLIDDYKFKLQKCEQEINTLQTNVSSFERLLLLNYTNFVDRMS